MLTIQELSQLTSLPNLSDISLKSLLDFYENHLCGKEFNLTLLLKLILIVSLDTSGYLARLAGEITTLYFNTRFTENVYNKREHYTLSVGDELQLPVTQQRNSHPPAATSITNVKINLPSP